MALLSQTYSKYDEMQVGLYNFILLEEMPLLEWDDTYGGLITTRSTVVTYLWIVICWPIYILINVCANQYFNKFVALVQYFPLGLLIIVPFTVINIVLAPLAIINNHF